MCVLPVGPGGGGGSARAVAGMGLVHVSGPRPHALWPGGGRSLPLPILHHGGEKAKH